MLIKEQEARTLVCPLSMATTRQSAFCLGSACMAWRPVATQVGEVGYCGMAGYPPKVSAPLIGQTIETALAGVVLGGEQGRIEVPGH